MHGPTHLGHVHLKVRDLERAVEFYGDTLDLSVGDRFGNFAFLSFGDHHHDLALQAVPTDDPAPGGRTVGLYHSAWEVPDEAALRATHERLQSRGVAVTPVDHRISLALYFDDPDGNGVEVYLDTRERNDREAWAGENHRFDPSALAGGDESDGEN
jgi:catechol 2,3-dioxygenase